MHSTTSPRLASLSSPRTMDPFSPSAAQYRRLMGNPFEDDGLNDEKKEFGLNMYELFKEIDVNGSWKHSNVLVFILSNACT